MPESRFKSCHEDLLDLLGLGVPPIEIAFLSEIPSGIRRIERALPPPTPDGRTGAVAASCVFWIEATEAVFATVAEDHGNCSVGSLTHGFKTMAQIARNADVAALCESGWVTPDAVAKIAVVRDKPASIVYGPLRDLAIEPAVILLRLNGKQLCCCTTPGQNCASKASRNAISSRSPRSAAKLPSASAAC